MGGREPRVILEASGRQCLLADKYIADAVDMAGAIRPGDESAGL